MNRSLSIAKVAIILSFTLGLPLNAASETASEAAERHARVAKRRADVHAICHRGASEFAHENTMEAYRAAFELGADGNEIDIRRTKDGVLVCFHDDMLDHLLDAYGDVSDYTWDELQRMPFRDPGRFGKYCRVPTLKEVFELHRKFAGLMHLDVKRPGLSESICQLLDELDMWDQVVQAPGDFTDPRIQRTPVKASLYLDRSEVDPVAIEKALQRSGKMVIVDDPRGVVLALGRSMSDPSDQPVSQEIARWSRIGEVHQPSDGRTIEALVAVLNNAPDWNRVAKGSAAEAKSAQEILSRARAADELARRKVNSPVVLAALEERVRQRSLHRDWRYCGLDGSAALRAMIVLKAPAAVDVARFCLWRDDPAVADAKNPEFDNPISWTDWRTKIPVFEMLERLPGEETAQLCRDYLALSDEEANQIGVPQFEAAAKTLLTIHPTKTTATELMRHRLSVVRGRAILDCLAHVQEAWAKEALKESTPSTLRYAFADEGHQRD